MQTLFSQTVKHSQYELKLSYILLLVIAKSLFINIFIVINGYAQKWLLHQSELNYRMG